MAHQAQRRRRKARQAKERTGADQSAACPACRGSGRPAGSIGFTANSPGAHLREEARQQEQQLGEQRSRQEAVEAELRQKQEAADQLREELLGDKMLVDQERRMLQERAGVLDTAVAQLRQAQERLAADEQRVREQTLALDTSTAQQAEATSLLQARISQYDEVHKRLEAERENLRERSLLLAQAEQAGETLQEQLRRRSEDLAARQKSLQEQVARYDADAAALQAQRNDIESLHQHHRDELAGERQALDQKQSGIDHSRRSLSSNGPRSTRRTSRSLKKPRSSSNSAEA